MLRDPPSPAAWNMAVDEALARSVGAGEGVLRIYRWSRPTLSLGRNQPARERYDPEAPGPLGAEIVRRPTGGREVLHDRELTYAVVIPVRALGGLREAYGTINAALVAAVRSLGIDAHTAPDAAPVLGLDAGACFGAPAPGEVTAHGRKLVGSAQVRIGRALLQHGSLLLAPPTIPLDALRAHPAREDAAGVTLSELVPGPLPFARVSAAVESALAGTFGGRWERGALDDREREAAEGLLEKYGSSAWTWRR